MVGEKDGPGRSWTRVLERTLGLRWLRTPGSVRLATKADLFKIGLRPGTPKNLRICRVKRKTRKSVDLCVRVCFSHVFHWPRRKNVEIVDVCVAFSHMFLEGRAENAEIIECAFLSQTHTAQQRCVLCPPSRM